MLIVKHLGRQDVVVSEARVATIVEAACLAGWVAAVSGRVGVDERS